MNIRYILQPSVQKTLNGIGVPVARRNKPRLTGCGFFIAQTWPSFWRAVWGTLKSAPDLARYANPHGLPPLIVVRSGRFQTCS